eukprot:246764-Alexandrium_andersonii.AAC.1
MRTMDITVLLSSEVCGQCACARMRSCVPCGTFANRTRQPWSSPLVSMKRSTASACDSPGFCHGNRQPAASGPAPAAWLGGGT